MAYEKKISRQHPGLIVLVLDDSGSMDENLQGTSDEKFQWVERYVGLILKELLACSTEVKGDDVVIKPRYYLYVIIYGSNPKVWGNGEMDIEAVVELYTNAGNSLGLGGHLEGTDTASAMQMAYDYLKGAVQQERFLDSFPPMMFHLTDGESQTDATSSVEQIKDLATSDGNALVVNAYIGTHTSLNYQGPEDFPGYVDANEAGSSDDNIRMFDMSSKLPACISQNLVDDGIFPELRDGARAFFDVRTKEMLKHVMQVVGSIGSRAERQYAR
ncbi:MAG: VWA domain-containing protein [Planctomycetes bacterium]|nr:VWA domain-containing protein [Planctomycetota bacterium]